MITAYLLSQLLSCCVNILRFSKNLCGELLTILLLLLQYLLTFSLYALLEIVLKLVMQGLHCEEVVR